jgi:hypothetical protein
VDLILLKALAVPGWQLTTFLSGVAWLLNRQVGQFLSAGVPLKRKVSEFRVTEDALLPVGTLVGAAHFTPGQYLDIQGAFTTEEPFPGLLLVPWLDEANNLEKALH